ncbi:MAG: DUF86 domain-containing protein [Clostridia bacterium]|nr:DUF86 domain-containing protein [Clostridia bacterium]
MKDKNTVGKMLFYCNKILSYTKNKTPKEVESDSILAEACVFNLSQIGELSHRVSRHIQEKTPHIPWRSLYGLRNKIVHEYDGLTLTLIWEIIFEDIPKLKNELEKLFL